MDATYAGWIRERMRVPLLLAAILMAGCRHQTAATPAARRSIPLPEIAVVVSTTATEKVFTANANGCEISLSVAREGSPDADGARLRRGCDVSSLAQRTALGNILDKVLGESASRPPFRSLLFGRLTPDHAPGEYLPAFRLALTAHRSALWSSKRGRPTSPKQVASDVVRELGTPEVLVPEVQKLFRDRGLQLETSGIEKVLVLPVSKLPFGGELEQQGVKPDERLPFDAIVSFKVTAD